MLSRATRRTLGYLPQLDGVRAIAVLMVFGTHDGVPHMYGGQIGVDIFFVLSGFLITTLLLTEIRDTGTVDLRQFYIRRFRRLYPAMLVAVVVSTVLAAIIVPGKTGHSLVGAVFSLTYLSGEARTLGIGDLGVFNHTWSLSAEELFYLVFPVVLVIAIRRHLRVERLVYAATGLAIAYRLLLHHRHTGTDFDRLYFGPDVRAEQILIGCSLACLVWAGRDGRLPRAAKRAALGAALAGIALCFSPWFGYTQYFTYGAELAAIAGAGVIWWIVSEPESFLTKALSTQPMTWLGRRSYAFYLCHYPIITFVTQIIQTDMGLPWRYNVVSALVLSLAAAHLLNRYVERRFRRHRTTLGNV